MILPAASYAQANKTESTAKAVQPGEPQRFNDLTALAAAHKSGQLKGLTGNIRIEKTAVDGDYLLVHTKTEDKDMTDKDLRALDEQRAAKVCAAVGQDLDRHYVREMWEKDNVVKMGKGLTFTRGTETVDEIPNGTRTVTSPCGQHVLRYVGNGRPIYGDYIYCDDQVPDFKYHKFAVLTSLHCKPKEATLKAAKPADLSTQQLTEILKSETNCTKGGTFKTVLSDRFFKETTDYRKKQISDQIVAFDRRCENASTVDTNAVVTTRAKVRR